MRASSPILNPIPMPAERSEFEPTRSLRSDDPARPTQTAIDGNPSAAEIAVEPTAPAPTVPGYELIRRLGRGGMGVVYEARQVKANRVVALEMILTAEHAAPRDLARFRAEAEAVAALEIQESLRVQERLWGESTVKNALA
jgi:eukaryotic-like serine/threonine-protein kinase